VKIVWTSEPLPNDALVVRAGLDPAITEKVRAAALAIDDDSARTLLPAHYTGWVAASHASYSMIEDAGVALGIIKR
jgi:phosphonate transport system substrate-binding protein